jgi:L-lactate dehydrogenase complex protein LldE
MTSQAAATGKRPSVGLFVTCLVDLFRPSIGFAAIKLLQDAGAAVEVPESQTCCGQPAYNSGDRADAKAIAKTVIESFERFDYVVAPSGSCAGMLKVHYPTLLADDPAFAERARALGEKSFELTSFLVEILGADSVTASFGGNVTYHVSCPSLRERKVNGAPRRLLASVDGLALTEMEETEVCCGFGGAFSVKYPNISDAIGEAKARNAIKSGADCLLAGDLGCLLHIAGKLSRDGARVKCRHVAEVLAGMTDTPAIGQPRKAE